MNKLKRITVATLLSVLCGAPAFAQYSEGGGGGKGVGAVNYGSYHPSSSGSSVGTQSTGSSGSSGSAGSSGSSGSTASSTGTTTSTSGTTGGSTSTSTGVPLVPTYVWPDQSYLKYYASSSGTPSGTTGPHLGHPPTPHNGSGGQLHNIPELVAVYCDTCSGTINGLPCGTEPNPTPPPATLNPCYGSGSSFSPTAPGTQLSEDGAIAFWVNYLHSLWVEVLKPVSFGTDGAYVGVRMDGGTGGVATPLALPALGTWTINVLGDFADLNYITVFHVNIVQGTPGQAPGYSQLALYTNLTGPAQVTPPATPTSALYYVANTSTNINTVTFQLASLPPKSVLDYIYVVKQTAGSFSLLQSGAVCGRPATPNYIEVFDATVHSGAPDCNLTYGYTGTQPPTSGVPPLGYINCTLPQ